MVIERQLRERAEKHLDIAIGIYEDLKASKVKLNEFSTQFGSVENPYDFMHGYIMGDLQGIAFTTVRTLLNRPLRDDEQKDLVVLTKSKRHRVSDLIERLKLA